MNYIILGIASILILLILALFLRNLSFLINIFKLKDGKKGAKLLGMFADSNQKYFLIMIIAFLILVLGGIAFLQLN